MGNSQNRPVRDKIFDLFFKYPVNAKIEKKIKNSAKFRTIV